MIVIPVRYEIDIEHEIAVRDGLVAVGIPFDELVVEIRYRFDATHMAAGGVNPEYRGQLVLVRSQQATESDPIWVAKLRAGRTQAILGPVYYTIRRIDGPLEFAYDRAPSSSWSSPIRIRATRTWQDC